MKHRYYLALGSNLGDRSDHLQQARTQLGQFGDIIKASSIIETKPFGAADQLFLNQVLVYQTDLEPVALLDAIKQIETELGRTFAARWGNREIDIDIILWDGEKIDTVTPHGYRLIIPHPGLPQRQFFIKLLDEIK
ncbi:MAG: 2-amino-4-hydroxy-6-hydroxymethyldihydropteridine diphosphokinase [Candidatus Kerfeldbacteria bacterium]|nr:2-amino-4-hydroxy-6-hydroxymethyldihydropteridine diphosphokinase [Candidatus Kerfeldbacteria bacterium]